MWAGPSTPCLHPRRPRLRQRSTLPPDGRRRGLRARQRSPGKPGPPPCSRRGGGGAPPPGRASDAVVARHWRLLRRPEEWARNRCNDTGSHPAGSLGHVRRSNAPPPPGSLRSPAYRSRIASRDDPPGPAARMGGRAIRACQPPLDRDKRLAINMPEHHQAGVLCANATRIPPDHDRTSAAIAFVAAFLGAGQAPPILTQVIQNGPGGIHAGQRHTLSVQTKGDIH